MYAALANVNPAIIASVPSGNSEAGRNVKANVLTSKTTNLAFLVLSAPPRLYVHLPRTRLQATPSCSEGLEPIFCAQRFASQLSLDLL